MESTNNSIINANGVVPKAPVSGATIAAVVSSILGFFVFLILIVVIGYFSSPGRPGTSPQMTQTGSGRFRQGSTTKGLSRAVLEAMPVSIFTGARIAEEGEKETIELGASLAHTKSMALTKEDFIIRSQGKEPGAYSCVGQYNEVSGRMPDALIAIPEPAHRFQSADLLPQQFQQLSRPTIAGVTCLVCVDDFVDGDRLRTLPCGHDFHAACIDPWLLDRSTACPSW